MIMCRIAIFGKEGGDFGIKITKKSKVFSKVLSLDFLNIWGTLKKI